MNKTPTQQEKPCNDRCKQRCPLKGNFQAENIVYRKATVAIKENRQIHYGTSEGELKLRFNNHNQSLKNRKKINKKELSKYIWQSNESHIAFN